MKGGRGVREREEMKTVEVAESERRRDELAQGAWYLTSIGIRFVNVHLSYQLCPLMFVY